jgi:hypothetical protein
VACTICSPQCHCAPNETTVSSTSFCLHPHFVTVTTKSSRPVISLLICYISLFPLFPFVSAILFNSLPWLIYFSVFISLFPYRSIYFFRHLFICLSLYFLSFSFFFAFFNFVFFIFAILFFACNLSSPFVVSLFVYVLISLFIIHFLFIYPIFSYRPLPLFLCFSLSVSLHTLGTHTHKHTCNIRTFPVTSSHLTARSATHPQFLYHCCLSLSSATLSAVFVYHHQRHQR